LLPVEIFEYKNRWKPGYTVRLHSDLRMSAKDYCRVQMFQHQWDVAEYSYVYEDTYMFEHKLDADSFAAQWEPRFVNQQRTTEQLTTLWDGEFRESQYDESVDSYE